MSYDRLYDRLLYILSSYTISHTLRPLLPSSLPFFLLLSLSYRFLELVQLGHYTNLPFTRVCPKYITQFGKKYLGTDAGISPTYLQDGGISVIQDDPPMWGKRYVSNLDKS